MAEEKRPRGRPRKYARIDGKHGGADLHLRLDPEVLEWVRLQGGAAYVRDLLNREMARAKEPALAPS